MSWNQDDTDPRGHRLESPHASHPCPGRRAADAGRHDRHPTPDRGERRRCGGRIQDARRPGAAAHPARRAVSRRQHDEGAGADRAVPASPCRHAVARRSHPRRQPIPQHRRRQSVHAGYQRRFGCRGRGPRRQRAVVSRAGRSDDYGEQQLRHQPDHRTSRREERPEHDGRDRRARYARAAGRGRREGVREGIEQLDHGARAADVDGGDRAGQGRGRRGEPGDGRDPEAPEGARSDSGRVAARHRGGAQDGGDHENSARRGDRLRGPAVRAGRARARVGRCGARVGAGRQHHPRAVLGVTQIGAVRPRVRRQARVPLKDPGAWRSTRYDRAMDLLSTADTAAAPELRDRTDIADRYKWNLTDIFSDWDAWQRGYAQLEEKIAAYAALQGTLAAGSGQLLAAMQLSDEIGQLTYKVWYFAGLKYDEDQRDNQINARRQQVQILFAKASQACAWFNPELLAIPLPAVQQWMQEQPALALYRFALEDLYRQQEHVLDEKGEQLLSLASRFSSAPNDAYAALSTADIKHPTIHLSTGAEVTLTYGQYRAILATNRNQADRAA